MFRPSITRYAAARTTARDLLRQRSISNSLPLIPTCPTPTCDCAEMPRDLDIDRSMDLNGTMAPYAEHVVVSSGQTDWTSKIEDEKSTAPWGEFVANVKAALSQRGGSFHNPYHNVVVSTSSFQPPSTEHGIARALLFPSFKMIEQVKTSEGDVPDFIKSFLLPETLHSAHGQAAEREQQQKTRDPANVTAGTWAGRIFPISSPTILICSHHTRDSRCGVLGPLLHAEFTQYINKRHSLRNAPSDDFDGQSGPRRSFASHPDFIADVVDRTNHSQHPVNIGMISHIGGHKFAGNVIIYIPPDYHCQPTERVSRGTKPTDQSTPAQMEKRASETDALDTYTEGLSPLAGKGIWYGRVEPRHVEGIVEQTIAHGNIIKELFRGGINQDGSTIRLPLY